jgi:glycosyltransferase involved in cell wall biosynthesis
MPALSSASPAPALECSLVIPFFNEAESVAAVLSEACAVMQALNLSHEVIAVDDGSKDATRRLACDLRAQWPNLRVLAFDKNRGQAAALLDGLRIAQGRVLITMDGDGQNDPANIPALLKRLAVGDADMIATVRANRKDGWVRRRMSRIANAVRQSFLHDGVRDSGCALKAFRREVFSALIPIRTLYSFIPALAVAAGYKVAEIDVNHRARETGVSKYGLGVMLWRPLVDMIGIWWFARRRFQDCEPATIE